MIELTKSCYRCKVTKTMEEFHFDRSTPDGYVGICKPCAKSRDRSKYGRVREKQIRNARSWNAKNPERYRDGMYRRKFGITIEIYNAMLSGQSGGCAICGGTNGAIALAVDHDAATGQVRGLLCRACNQAIGLLRDSPDLCVSASRYLERAVTHPRAAR